MRSQSVVNPTMVMDRIRVLGNVLRVVKGPKFEVNLAEQLQMPEYTPAEIAEAVDNLVQEGKLICADQSLNLGRGGISNTQVDEEITVFSTKPILHS